MGGYDGLFGPDTMTWRVHGDPVMWIGGLRALLLQATHPAAMAGVLEHSDFRADPWGRLLRTADYVGVVSYGTRSAVDRVGARVRGLHRKVRGVDGRTGRTCRADDPRLLTWVHCCEVDSFLSIYRRSGGGLTDAQADRYLAEQTRAAQVVGLDPAAVPADRRALQRYFAGVRPELVADGRVRRLAGYVLWPPMPRRVAALTPARPAWMTVAALAVALLPRWARRLYGLPTGGPAAGLADLVTTAELRALTTALRALPAALREGPHQRAARERLSDRPGQRSATSRPAAARNVSGRLGNANRI